MKKDDEHNEFIIDVQLSICLPIDGDKKFCIPNEGELHLIENKHIPACLDQLADYQGNSIKHAQYNYTSVLIYVIFKHVH